MNCVIDHVLVPMDHSPLARRALEYALDVHPTATVTVIYVIDYIEESYSAQMLIGTEELRERAAENAQALFEEANEIAGGSGTELTTVTKFGNPARNIITYADEVEVDLIVIGSHGRSLISRILLGDTANKVVHQAPVPVTVVR